MIKAILKISFFMILAGCASKLQPIANSYNGLWVFGVQKSSHLLALKIISYHIISHQNDSNNLKAVLEGINGWDFSINIEPVNGCKTSSQCRDRVFKSTKAAGSYSNPWAWESEKGAFYEYMPGGERPHKKYISMHILKEGYLYSLNLEKANYSKKDDAYIEGLFSSVTFIENSNVNPHVQILRQHL